MPNNLAQFSSDNCMRTNTKSKRSALLLLLFSVVMGVGGCTDYYGTYPAYGRPYYGGYGSYGPGYFQRYAAYPRALTVEAGDLPYYTHAPGHYVARAYHVATDEPRGRVRRQKQLFRRHPLRQRH